MGRIRRRAVSTWRVTFIAFAVTLAMALTPGPVGAAHTVGTLDCGNGLVFEVEGIATAGPPFDVPPPWSGIFLLAGTTQVFPRLLQLALRHDDGPRQQVTAPTVDVHSHLCGTYVRSGVDTRRNASALSPQREADRAHRAVRPA